MADHRLPFKTAPKLIKLSQELYQNISVLQHLSRRRITFPHKIRLGLAKTNDYELSTFLNYLDLKGIIVEHLALIEIVTFNAGQVLNKTKTTEEHSLPWGKLLSILLGSQGVIRGKKICWRSK